MKLLFYLLFFLFFTTACRSSDNEQEETIPAATQTGENKAGCTLNGELFIAKNGLQNFGSPGKPYGILFSEPFNLSLRNYERTKFLNIKYSVNAVREYPFQNQISMQYQDENGAYFYAKPNSGKLVISRLDSGIYSGTFEGTLYNQDSGKTIIVNSGRFDINKLTLNK